jgi:DNA-binding beta-propeller fold protein YncE
VHKYDLTIGWDITSASNPQGFSVEGQDTFPTSLTFNADGSKMYMLGSTGDAVYEYDLSTVWDITTAVYLHKFSVASEDSSPRGIFFKPDGLKMYVAGYSGSNVIEYALATAWDISTASFLQSFNVLKKPTSLTFNPVGSRMYILSDAVYEYGLDFIFATDY